MTMREDIFQAKNEEGRESVEDDGQSANNNSLKVAFKGTMNDDGPSSRCQTLPEVQNIQMSTCKILQRKLELKVERAKKNYSQLQEENAKKAKPSNLIPIDRLQIPGYAENQPLVDYKSESDDGEEVSFFPSKLKSAKKQDLTDTFSIQEMTIESDNTDDSESQNLELLPPSSNSKFLDRLLSCFYCSDGNT
ncbi:uncharacterized protein LOC119651829 isoform X2 [Hermetia illucens]|uniref:uncharacterized protein LOC119651829 isoform X2 n=1 Tax=Hermetia illucens TaxID=343691 RepID=UPI0018CC12EE|nr:uncharacterized protein LOC119651829 isoform X2 [Hermetia illucens]